MKRLLLILIFTSTFVSCVDKKETTESVEETTIVEEVEVTTEVEALETEVKTDTVIEVKN